MSNTDTRTSASASTSMVPSHRTPPPERPLFNRPAVVTPEGLRRLAEEAALKGPQAVQQHVDERTAAIIATYSRSIKDIDAYALEEIDALIEKLMRLKQIIQSENERTIANFSKFVHTARDIRGQIVSVGNIVDELEQNVVVTESK